jgi:hypothetical protein
MRNQFRNHALLVVFFLASLGALAQSRSDVFSVADAVVTEVVLSPRPDGGCAARWCLEVSSADGGAALTSCTSDDVELKVPLNQSRCSALASAGLNRAARQLRFDVDAGTP